MSRTVGGVLALLLALPALAAEDKPKDKPQTPQEQYKALVKEYDDAMQAFQKAYGAAKTDEERNKVFEEKYPKTDKLTPKFLELAEKNSKDPAAIDALVWVVSNNRGQPGMDNPRAKALAVLLRDHPDSDKLGTICQQMAYDYDKSSETFLRTVLEKNKSKDVQGQAILTLAQYMKRRAQLVEQIKDHPEAVARMEGFLGKEFAEELKKMDVAKLNKDVEGLFDRAVEKYGDVKVGRNTIGERAKGELFEIRNLVVGKEAPEVAGEDIEGKKFKLSDYRGKVVLIDFWGNW